MIYSWLKYDDKADNVIVFFNGWGLSESAVEHLAINVDTNVLIVSDYTDLDTQLPDLNAYQQRNLIAWSFGVANYAAWQQQNLDVFDTKVAVNGTIQGIDRTFGIADKVVQHTIDTLGVDSFKEFICRCYNVQSINDLDHLNNTVASINIDAKKLELQNIKDREYINNTSLTWDAVWVSQQDKIFPGTAQKCAWQENFITLIDAPHAPFAQWTNWQDLLAIA